MTTLPVRGPTEQARLCVEARFWLRVMRASGPYKYIYFLFFVPHLFGWVLNLVHTSDPVSTYQHDVFDSIMHFRSFVAFKGVLFISWVVIYPPVEFLFFTTALATGRIIRLAERSALIVPRVEHPDQCYGLKNIGTLNIALLLPFFLIASSMYSIVETHRTLYPAIVVPAAILAVTFLWTSFVIIRPVHRILSGAKRSAYRSLARRLKELPPDDSTGFPVAIERFLYSTANASPYSAGTKAMLLAMRGASLVPVVLKFVR